ncbi:hypothetical protein HU200_026256 [Digitaria exilis]|uniref:Uncharacterized protein n=1 Tax=Digitaria exilis TaxID=1010633 RepID=A0A835C0B6_9POAL|nr:hypothetical protein HU200_026256 [Digitaria exilis]
MEARNCNRCCCAAAAASKRETEEAGGKLSRTRATCGARERPQRQPIAGSPVLPCPTEHPPSLVGPTEQWTTRSSRRCCGGRRAMLTRRGRGGGDCELAGETPMCEACDARGGSERSWPSAAATAGEGIGSAPSAV